MNKELFADKNFRIFLSGQTIAVLGDWLGIIAVITLAGFRWQVTPFQMSMVVFCLAAPMFLAGPFGGVIADRVDRGRMMSVTCLLRACLLFFIIQAASFVFLLLLLVLLGAFDACFLTAKNAKIKEIPTAGNIDDAVIYSSFVDQGGRVFGPAVAGLVLTFFSIEIAIYLNILFYIVAALFFLFIGREITANVAKQERIDFWLEFKAGLDMIRTVPFIMYGAFIQIFVVLVLQMVDSQFVILLRSVEGASEAWVGYCLMASGTGTILMTGFYLKCNKDLNVKKSMFWGTAAYSVSVIGISVWGMFGGFPAGFLPFFILWGASGALIFVKYTTYAQANIPVEYSGRVFGSLGSMLSGASMAGLFCGGALVSWLGAANAFLVAGVLMLLGCLWLLHKNFR